MSELDHRRPKACPHCSQDGAFDGLGHFNREKAVYQHLDGDGWREVLESWYQYHCPECGNTFATLERTVTLSYDESGEEIPEERGVVGR